MAERMKWSSRHRVLNVPPSTLCGEIKIDFTTGYCYWSPAAAGSGTTSPLESSSRGSPNTASLVLLQFHRHGGPFTCFFTCPPVQCWNLLEFDEWALSYLTLCSLRIISCTARISTLTCMLMASVWLFPPQISLLGFRKALLLLHGRLGARCHTGW